MTEAASEAGSSDSGLKYLRYHLLRWSRVIIYIYIYIEREISVYLVQCCYWYCLVVSFLCLFVCLGARNIEVLEVPPFGLFMLTLYLCVLLAMLNSAFGVFSFMTSKC